MGLENRRDQAKPYCPPLVVEVPELIEKITSHKYYIKTSR